MASNVEQLIDRWVSDPAFRSAARANPEAAVRDAGITLTADERAAIGSIDWSQSDDQLTSRLSKQYWPGC